jgi:pyruvate dehydrogenase E2 component (dihydrolipoamide acetyltransferase)
MPTPFIMPKFDMDQETATIVSWVKHDGELVRQDETVLIVETDKVAIDVPAPATGTLARVCAKEGEVVPVTAIIAYILAEGETADAILGPTGKEPAQVPQPVAPAGPAVSPVAQRMARDLGVDLSRVPAPERRITKADVERYLQPVTPPEGGIPATPAARRLGREKGIDLAGVPGSGPGGRVQAADVLNSSGRRIRTAGSGREAEIVPLTATRRAIAERMQASFQDAPHIALTVEVDVSALETTRTHMNRLAEEQTAAKVTLTALLVRLVAWALSRHPYLNASLIEGAVHLWKDINVGVATAAPNGLIVPVIRNADQLSVRETNSVLQDQTTRAREGRLELRDVQDGTFTISNLGMYGIRQFRAVINPPESAILAVGATVRKPVVIDDKDEVAVRPILYLTISADHRVLDGAMAAGFLRDLVQAIEVPGLLTY